MKFTNNDLAKAMGLEIGDWVSVKCADGSSHIYKLNPDYSLSCNRIHIHLDDIIELDYEIIPRKKKVGELTCDEVGCYDCPLERCCWDIPVETLYENLERWNNKYNDKEIYDILKARLDKEVEE